jgi:NTE family protein
MLQALTEQDLIPDLVVGSSVGALNGAVLGLDPRGAANRLRRIWPKITRQMVFPGGPLAQARTLQQGRTHLFPNTGLQALITGYFHTAMTFAELALPFGAVTMDVATTAPHVLRDGPLVPALLASAAIPGIFPAVSLDGRQLDDGGVVANVPVTQALAMGAQSLVVLDAAFPGRLPTAPATLTEARLFTAIVSMRVQAALEAHRGRPRTGGLSAWSRDPSRVPAPVPPHQHAHRGRVPGGQAVPGALEDQRAGSLRLTFRPLTHHRRGRLRSEAVSVTTPSTSNKIASDGGCVSSRDNPDSPGARGINLERPSQRTMLVRPWVERPGDSVPPGTERKANGERNHRLRLRSDGS